MTCLIYKNKPKTVVNLRPPFDFSMNRPNLFPCAFPSRDSLPIQRIQVVKYTRIVNDKVILTIKNESFHIILEKPSNISSIWMGKISSKIVLDTIIDNDKAYIIRYSKILFICIHISLESKVFISVISKIEDIHSCKVFVLCISVIVIH